MPYNAHGRNEIFFIGKASSDLQSSIATIKGLCFLGEKETDQIKAHDYWLKLSNTSDHLSSILKKLSYQNREQVPIS